MKSGRTYNQKTFCAILMLGVLVLLAVFFQKDMLSSLKERGENNHVQPPNAQITDSELEIHFLDVGQADATLLICEGQAMLIDAGENDQGTAIQLYLKKQGVGENITLDYVIGTHPHSDHIGGLDVIINKFEIGTIFLTDDSSELKTYLDVLDAMEYYHYERTLPKPGDTLMLGSAKVTFVAPVRKDSENLNNNSIGVLVEHGDNRFLFLGDAEEEAERDILQGETDVSDVTLYKVNHHGSRDSSSEEFLSVIHPKYAVISVGAGNDYGHPHAQTLNRLRSLGADIYRTDEQGSIVATSDGEKITFNCAPSRSYQAGE